MVSTPNAVGGNRDDKGNVISHHSQKKGKKEKSRMSRPNVICDIYIKQSVSELKAQRHFQILFEMRGNLSFKESMKFIIYTIFFSLL